MKSKKQSVVKAEKSAKKISVTMSACTAERLARAACEGTDVATALMTVSN